MLSIFWNLSPSSCSMAKSFKTNYVLADPASNSAWQLLCSWDFSITNERAVRQRKNNLRVQLKVNISQERERRFIGSFYLYVMKYRISKTTL